MLKGNPKSSLELLSDFKSAFVRHVGTRNASSLYVIPFSAIDHANTILAKTITCTIRIVEDITIFTFSASSRVGGAVVIPQDAPVPSLSSYAVAKP